jgi:hypothetical protein
MCRDVVEDRLGRELINRVGHRRLAMSALSGWSQPVDATLALNLSAGVSIPKALLGRSLSRRTALFRWAFEDTDNRLSSEITEYTPSFRLGQSVASTG